jgi:hypothetical protein
MKRRAIFICAPMLQFLSWTVGKYFAMLKKVSVAPRLFAV